LNSDKSCSGNLKNNITQNNNPVNNVCSIKGLLHNILLNKTELCKYIKKGETSYFLSHGGINNSFYNKPNSLLEYYNFILDGFNYNSEKIKNKYGWQDNALKPEEFAIYCNSFLKDIINITFKIYRSYLKSNNVNKYNFVKANIFFLLALSAPFNCLNNKFINCNDHRQLSTIDFPILDSTLNKLITANSIQNTDVGIQKLYQIFGHQSLGLAPRIFLPMFVNDEATVLVNLDTTDSFSNTLLNDLEKNVLYLKIENDNFEIVTDITFKTTSDKIRIFSNDNVKNKIDFDGDIIYSKDIDLQNHINTDGGDTRNFTIKINSNNLDSRKLRMIQDHNDKQLGKMVRELQNKMIIGTLGVKNIIGYQGGDLILGKDIKNNINIFTLRDADSFNRVFYFLNESDFEIFMGTPPSSISTPQSLKYLKYKMKYYNLKK
jgi:hypothetical protein